jgi:hypothetical protein
VSVWLQASPSSHTEPPASNWQTDEQQSPSAVLPSSQASAPSTTPSPQTEGSISHMAEHPSPPVVFPSSQVSPFVGSTIPFPHTPAPSSSPQTNKLLPVVEKHENEAELEQPMDAAQAWKTAAEPPPELVQPVTGVNPGSPQSIVPACTGVHPASKSINRTTIPAGLAKFIIDRYDMTFLPGWLLFKLRQTPTVRFPVFTDHAQTPDSHGVNLDYQAANKKGSGTIGCLQNALHRPIADGCEAAAGETAFSRIIRKIKVQKLFRILSSDVPVECPKTVNQC